MSVQIRNTPGIGEYITINNRRGKVVENKHINKQTTIIQNQGKLSKKDLMEIINSQSEQILGLKQIIDNMKNDNMEIFRGNCDPEKTTIHRDDTQTNEKKVSQWYFILL